MKANPDMSRDGQHSCGAYEIKSRYYNEAKEQDYCDKCGCPWEASTPEAEETPAPEIILYSFTYGPVTKERLAAANKGRGPTVLGCNMRLTPIAEAVCNQGIDSHLEACMVPARGDGYEWTGRRSLRLTLSEESVLVFIRRMSEHEDEEAQDTAEWMAEEILRHETPAQLLEHIRSQVRAERMSYMDIARLQSLEDKIDPSDVELLAWVKGCEE
jgi:hypothetical protein